MVFQCINIRQVPWEVLKTAAFGLGFQHFLQDLANVNAWKTMFDPYIILYSPSKDSEPVQGFRYPREVAWVPSLLTECSTKFNQIVRMRRLIWVFTHRSCNHVGNA